MHYRCGAEHVWCHYQSLNNIFYFLRKYPRFVIDIHKQYQTSFFFFVWIFSLLLYLSVSKNFQINLTRNYKWANSTTNIKRQTKIMKQREKMTYKVSNWKSIVVTRMKKNWKKTNNTCLKKKNRRSFSCWYKISQNYRLFANIKCSKVLFHFSEIFSLFFKVIFTQVCKYLIFDLRPLKFNFFGFVSRTYMLINITDDWKNLNMVPCAKLRFIKLSLLLLKNKH